MRMRRFATTVGTAILAVFSLHYAQAQTGVDLLENGGFEYAATGLSNGNNIGKTPTGWTVTAGEANWQQGTATGTGAVAPLPAYNGAYSGGATTAYNSNTDTVGSHFFDGTQRQRRRRHHLQSIFHFNQDDQPRRQFCAGSPGCRRSPGWHDRQCRQYFAHRYSQQRERLGVDGVRRHAVPPPTVGKSTVSRSRVWLPGRINFK